MSAFVDDPDLRLAGRLDMDSEGLVFLTHGGLNQLLPAIQPIKNTKPIWFKSMVMSLKMPWHNCVKAWN